MNNFGYMNIKTGLVKRSKDILNLVLKGKQSIPKSWIFIAKCEGFRSIEDWILKELAIIEWELETRKRFFKGEKVI